MAEADSQYQCLLSQRPFRSLHKLGDLRDWSFCFRMLLQRLDVGRRVWLACWCFLFGLGHFLLLKLDPPTYIAAHRPVINRPSEQPAILRVVNAIPEIGVYHASTANAAVERACARVQTAQRHSGNWLCTDRGWPGKGGFQNAR